MNFGYALKCRQTYAFNYLSVGFGSSESLKVHMTRNFFFLFLVVGYL